MFEPDRIIRSNRRTLSISVDVHGQVLVRAPRDCSKERIFAFLQEKADWIRKQQEKRRRENIPLPSENLEGYVLPLLGKPTTILLVEGKKISYDGEKNLLYLPKEKSKERLVKWLKDNAKRIFTAVTKAQAERMKVKYTSVGVNSARAQWGSCSGENVIRYTFRLLYCPREILDYVAVHELAHVRHKDHSKAFWREVEKYLPDWRERRKWLKMHAVYLEIF